MTRVRFLVLALALLPVAVAGAQSPSPDGRSVFARACAPCHGAGRGIDGSAMLPGTAALAAKYRGSLPAPLEARDDLDAATLRYFVRNGAGAMPMFRKTEISDAEIAAVARYLKE